MHPGLHRYGRPVGFQLDTHSGLGEDGNYIPETAELIVAEKPGIQRGIVTVDAPGGHVAGEVAAALAARFSWRHLTEENISTNDLADLDECVVSGRTSGRRMADALVRFWIPDPGGSHPADPATGPDIDAMALDPKLPISVLIARMEERVRIASLQRRM